MTTENNSAESADDRATKKARCTMIGQKLSYYLNDTVAMDDLAKRIQDRMLANTMTESDDTECEMPAW